MNYLDNSLVKDIGEKIMIVWIMSMDKCFKNGIEGLIKLQITADMQINLFELRKLVKNEYGLGKDKIFTDNNLKVFDNFDLAWNTGNNIWVSRYRYEQSPKAGEIVNIKIATE
jgi:hypothetical protein